MKKLLILMSMVIVMTIASTSSRAQAVVMITEGAKITKQVYKAVSWLKEHKEIFIAIIHGFGYDHRWWKCIYRDGFVTRNDFRDYRTAADAYNYFVLGHGDRDAIYGPDNKHISYETPMHAKKYSEQHGPIVDIRYEYKKGKYRSIFDY